MCGIAGMMKLGAAPDPGVLARMGAAIAHRGPDGEGIRTLGEGATHIALVHRRLAILDLSERGAQPMASSDGSAWITYNGEIYNFIELRDELRALGHAFESASDTEVLLAAWRQWGRDMLPRLNGMFAFSIWDTREHALFLARDRFGEKPLFWTAAGDSFVFGSEMKALFPALPPRAIDEGWLYRFLQFGRMENEPATFVSGIARLLPGHWLDARVENGRIATRTAAWYALPEPGSLAPVTGDPRDRYRELFDDAVRIRLRSDVPLGSSLSGGLDSSAIVATLGRLAGDARHTFTCRMQDARLDEGDYAREVAESVKAIPHEVTPVAADLAADFDRLCAHQEEPFPSASIYAQFRVFQLARENAVTVLLDGQGADETLAGYPWYAGVAAAQRISRLSFAKARGLVDAGPVNARSAMLRTAFGDALREAIPRPLRSLAEGLRMPRGAASASLVSRSARARFGVPDRRRAELRHRNWLDAVLRFSVEEGPLQSLLRFADRNSMAFGREVRLPFLDHRLVEMSFALPEEWKIGEGSTKRILREAMAGRVPERIRTRRDKLGFQAPDAVWLGGPLRPWFASRVRAAAERFPTIVDLPRVESALAAIEHDPAAVASLFPLVSAESCARSLETARAVAKGAA